MTISYRPDYPRPQLVRDTWDNLNRPWDFAFDDDDRGEREHWEQGLPSSQIIQVPFSYETEKSGVGDTTFHPVVWYSRTIQVPEETLRGNRVVLHLEGCDDEARVWVNGTFAGSHRGGYTRFSLDVTAWVKPGENRITVRASDSMDPAQMRGKQRWVPESFTCWYVQTTGIWKTVWLEYVPQCAVTELQITPLWTKGSVELKGKVEAPKTAQEVTLQAEAFFENVRVSCVQVPVPVTTGQFHVVMDLLSEPDDRYPWGLHSWTPEDPALYDLHLTVRQAGAVQDDVWSYFGLREIRTQNGQVLLNGEPLYQRLLLDQGYWEESGLTPPDEAALQEDIEKTLQLGYNGVRKHQKVEDERFFYWADVKGLLVWCEAPSAYTFGAEAVQSFATRWTEIVRQYENHPSIITWTPFNESWGVGQIKTDSAQQHFTQAIYHLTKSLDPMRPVIVNDGWEHTVSDILTLHDYEADGARFLARYTRFFEQIRQGEVYHNGFKAALADTFTYQGQPIIISEYGGIALQDSENGWGYGDKVQGEEAFLRRFGSITKAIRQIPQIVGYCYTQITDVQQEQNGLMDMQRHFKVDPEKIRAINTEPVDPESGLYR